MATGISFVFACVKVERSVAMKYGRAPIFYKYYFSIIGFFLHG